MESLNKFSRCCDRIKIIVLKDYESTGRVHA